MSKVISITKKTTSATAKRNANQPYWVLDVLVGPLHRARAAKYAVFLTGNATIDAEITAHMDNQIATKNFDQSLTLDYVTVGDTDVNPNTKPLPAYRTKDSNGVPTGAVHTSMQVLMEFENGKMVGSPRNQALRIIETMCEKVEFSEESPIIEGGQPPV